ncbi:MAG: DUF433 domain-containing protein [Bacteroidota bacterium]|nr:DUF433 domain-containing protein [Odoribacter sp.]MDP3643590.1 DUF433 domain-containing protein [Bacteroidota bacterium]
MKDTLQTKPILGTGIYTIPDIALILGIPYGKVLRWINTFWNDQFGSKYGHSYSWNVDLTKAVNFHTLIELFTFYQFSLAGVSSKELLKAHNILSEQYNTYYPFATKMILECLRTDGRKVLFEQKDGSIYSVDATRQFKLSFIKEFYKNIDFNSDSLAVRFWPIGKEKAIVCDPHHQFGQPVIYGTNINVEALYGLYKAGEPEWFIADLFNLDKSKVIDAIIFCKKAA